MKNTSKQTETDLQQLIFQSVVLLQRQYLLAEHLIANGETTLAKFEQTVIEGTQSIDSVFAVFNYCWALVDQLDRYRKIAAVVPKLNQKGMEFRAFEAAFKSLNKICNQFQHINNHVRNENSGPLLGSVCWVNGSAQFFASLPDIGRSRSVPGIPINTRTGTFRYKFCYVYNDVYYDLGGAIQGMRSFQKFVDAQVALSLDGTTLVQRDHFIAMRVEFNSG